MISNVYLTIFAFAMLGCVLATPLVTWVATCVGAIDRPDHFRRIHQGAIPRLGGLALAFGVAAGTLLDPSRRIDGLPRRRRLPDSGSLVLADRRAGDPRSSASSTTPARSAPG